MPVHAGEEMRRLLAEARTLHAAQVVHRGVLVERLKSEREVGCAIGLIMATDRVDAGAAGLVLGRLADSMGASTAVAARRTIATYASSGSTEPPV